MLFYLLSLFHWNNYWCHLVKGMSHIVGCPMDTWWNSQWQSNRSWLGWCDWAACKQPRASLSNVVWVYNPLTGWLKAKKSTYKCVPESPEANKDWRVITAPENPSKKTARGNPTAGSDGDKQVSCDLISLSVVQLKIQIVLVSTQTQLCVSSTELQ